jgi:hypothetical protein
MQVYKILGECEVFLMAEELIAGFPSDLKWKYEHAVGCRVIDHWNLRKTNCGVARCYYEKSVRWAITVPAGVVSRLSSLTI